MTTPEGIGRSEGQAAAPDHERVDKPVNSLNRCLDVIIFISLNVFTCFPLFIGVYTVSKDGAIFTWDLWSIWAGEDHHCYFQQVVPYMNYHASLDGTIRAWDFNLLFPQIFMNILLHFSIFCSVCYYRKVLHNIEPKSEAVIV
ncbi:hypothetical protein ACJX0J_029698 [Zea mays]